MVFKVGKGGVRSGNTLRGLNSTASKRYGRHACLLGHTSLGRRDLTRLITDSSEDNQLVSETLAKTDVLLSLNKQQRWRLPAMIGQMIKEGDFNKGAVVSLLEKHKLKRRANCVKLVSNNKRTSSIAPKNNKYFSFSLDSVADDQSIREKRRARAEELKRLKLSPSAKLLKKQTRKRNNVIETFTADGVPKAPTPTENTSSEKPEYRLEVFYPCPRSCSLTYNPKYTDVSVVEGKTGELEVKSNVRTQKKGLTTHRKRFSSRDIERLYGDEIDNDVDEMWEDECDDYENVEGDDSKNDNTDDQLSNYYYDSDISSVEYAMDALISQAKKARDLCVFKKESVEKKLAKRSNKMVSIYKDDKPHIVFLDEDSQERYFEKHIPVSNKEFEKFSPDNGEQQNSDFNSLEYFRVILSTVETSPEELSRTYGIHYTEASCQPRRFVLDVTDDVTNLLASSKASTNNKDFSSYLVCIYDGFYDNGLAAYKLAFNSMIGGKLNGLSDIISFTKTSMSNIMNAVACHLLDLKEKDSLVYILRDAMEVKGDGMEFLNSRLKLKVEVRDPSNETSKMAISAGTDKLKTELTNNPGLSMTMEDDLFCDVCYANVTSSRIDSVSGTKLKACGHLLCDECWAAHFRTGISEGKTVMACGGYDCNTKVESITLMSILNVSEVALLFKRQAEEEIETSENAKWCPNPECGRVIKVDSKLQDLCVDVNCACGVKLCFGCMGPAHWPARCDQAEEYMEKLPTLKPAKEYVEEESKRSPFLINKKSKKPETFKVEGRLCPTCSKFIEKNGGCPQMVCKCGFMMCWKCMKPYHSGFCKMDHGWVLKHTRTLIVKHAVSREILSPDSQISSERPKIQKNKQKASLYQRALQQREELAGTAKYDKSSSTSGLILKMVKLCQRYPELKKEVMTVLLSNNSGEKTIIDDKSLNSFDIKSHFKSFITTIVKMKKELHRVREYTFILLQGTPHSVAKQRILKLADDLNGFCSFVTSILELQDNQDAMLAFRRLVDLQKWAERALDALIKTTKSLRMEGNEYSA